MGDEEETRRLIIDMSRKWDRQTVFDNRLIGRGEKWFAYCSGVALNGRDRRQGA